MRSILKNTSLYFSNMAQGFFSFVPHISTKTLFLSLCKILIVLSMLVLFQHFCFYFSLGTSTIMLFNQFMTNTLGLASSAVPSISMTLNVMGGIGALHVLTQTGLLQKGFEKLKFLTVNTLPTRVVLNMAAVLPIGSWFEHEIAYTNAIHNTSLMYAVKENDEALLDKILKYVSKKALYRFLCENDWLDTSPLHHATNSFNDQKASLMRKLILAIDQVDRCVLLKKIRENKQPYMFHVLAKLRSKETIAFVLAAIPEKDRVDFLNQVDEKGNSLFIYQAKMQKPLDEIETLFSYVPSLSLVQLLKVTDKRGKTALMYFADNDNASRLEYVLSLIPKDKLEEFFSYQNQGVRSLLYANTVKNSRATFEVLSRYGLLLSDENKNISREELMQLETKTLAQEAFKDQVGEYPQDILGLVSNNPNNKEVINAFRCKIRQKHPDKQLNNKDDSEAKRLIQAYEFFTKEEARASYK